jgi:hypothetical protein
MSGIGKMEKIKLPQRAQRSQREAGSAHRSSVNSVFSVAIVQGEKVSGTAVFIVSCL